MALGEKKKIMLIFMFTKISHEERKCIVAKEFDQLKIIAAAEREFQGEIIEKRQVGLQRRSQDIYAQVQSYKKRRSKMQGRTKKEAFI